MTTLKMLAMASALAFALPGAASAQHKHGHTHSHGSGQIEKGRHGGQMVEAGGIHVELVTNDGVVDVYVSDHDDKPMSISGYKGLAILSVAGKSQRIVLEAGDDRLTGKATGALPAQPKGVVQVTPPNGKTVSAKF